MKRIIQISDLHIAAAGEYPHGNDSRQTFISTLDLIERVMPIDMIVVTGDIAHHTLDNSICSWIDLHLSAFEVPVHIVPGNHDNTKLIASFFSKLDHLQGDELFYSIRQDQRHFIFLDTADHSISDFQLMWLRDLLSECSHSRQHPVIFMHHPPCISGSLFMDRKYPFKRSEEFGEVLQIYNDIIPIFCGHYHIAKTVTWNNAVIFVTPSSCFEIDPFSSSFTLEAVPPGLRVIDLTDHGIQSSVLRI